MKAKTFKKLYKVSVIFFITVNVLFCIAVSIAYHPLYLLNVFYPTNYYTWAYEFVIAVPAILTRFYYKETIRKELNLPISKDTPQETIRKGLQ